LHALFVFAFDSVGSSIKPDAAGEREEVRLPGAFT
jgi:hypothetical protein